MTTPNFVAVSLVSGQVARAEDLQAMFSAIAAFLGNDTVTTDNIECSAGINILTSDGTNLTLNCPNIGSGGKFRILIGGVHVMTIDGSGNVVFKGTVTPSGSPS